uniref:Uncharacterized protein n=1 Tax=Avena sativa TaxID=4498 RepID=A0ACD5TNR2_AVESA
MDTQDDDVRRKDTNDQLCTVSDSQFLHGLIEWDQASIEAVNKLCRAFLWKNKREVLGGQCLVTWDVVTMPKRQGGLGIRNLRLQNRALMANLASKLLSGTDGPCFGWLARWYLQNSIPHTANQQDTAFWRSMLKLIPGIQSATECFPSAGDRTSFWHDKWTNMGRLNETFSVLYSFATDTHCTIQSQMTDGEWELGLFAPLSDTAHQQLLQLMDRLQHIQLQGDYDRRKMIVTGREPTTKDLYTLFSDRGMHWQQYEWVWQCSIPHRHKFFLWLAFRGRLNTKDNMIAKSWCHEAGCDQCPALESVHHIALHCRTSSWVWTQLGLQHTAATASSISQFVQEAQTNISDNTWPVCFAACLLGLWKARNDRVFNCKQISCQTLLTQIADYLRLWTCRARRDKQKLLTWAHRISINTS